MRMEPSEQEGIGEEERKKSMRACKADGAAYSAMTGAGDAYVSAAIVQLGASDFQVSLLTALPQFLGALSQFVSLHALRIAKDRRKLVVATAILQALCWLPIAALMLMPGGLSIPIIIVLFSVGSAFSLLGNPAWSSWVSDIVPENERASFFSDRSSLMQVVLFAVTFGAGLLLLQLQLSFGERVAYSLLFLLPFLFRVASAISLARMSGVKYELQLVREIRLEHLFILPSYRDELWFLVFIALVNFTSQFASPFFTPYMLNSLGLDVGAFGALTAASILAKIAAYPYWGKAIDRFGNRAVLVASAFGISLVPLMWLFSTDFRWLFAFQAFSGFVWAGLDISSFNYTLGLVGRELRPSFVSKYNSFSGFFNAAGAVAGGAFLVLLPNAVLLGFSGILLVFLISGVLRFAVVLAFAPKLSSSREPENKSGQRAMVFNLIAVYPTQGAVQQVVNGWNFTRKAVAGGTSHGGIALKSGIGATERTISDEGRKLASRMAKRKGL